MFFEKSLWKRLKGFDEKFFFTGEDLDLCLRAKKLGAMTIQIPNVKIIHKDGKTINRSELSYFKYYEGYKSKFRLILKHANLLQIIAAFFLQIFVYTPFRRVFLREKSFGAMIKALLWNLYVKT